MSLLTMMMPTPTEQLPLHATIKNFVTEVNSSAGDEGFTSPSCLDELLNLSRSNDRADFHCRPNGRANFPVQDLSQCRTADQRAHVLTSLLNSDGTVPSGGGTAAAGACMSPIGGSAATPTVLKIQFSRNL